VIDRVFSEAEVLHVAESGLVASAS
jgi:hypothetical protein